MNGTLTPAMDRASRFVREALLSPDQVDDVRFSVKDGGAKPAVKNPDHPAHAHGDFGHGDFGHADR